MSDEQQPKRRGRPPKNAPRPRGENGHRFAVPEGAIGHKDAYQAFIDLGPEATLESLHNSLKAKGIKSNINTIRAWSKRHEWMDRRDLVFRRRRTLSPNRSIVEVLMAEAEEYSADLVTGLQSRLIAKLAATIDEIEVKRPEDVERLVGVYKELQAIHHAVVGEEFFKKGAANGAQVTGANGHANGNGHAAENVVGLGHFSKRT